MGFFFLSNDYYKYKNLINIIETCSVLPGSVCFVCFVEVKNLKGDGFEEINFLLC